MATSSAAGNRRIYLDNAATSFPKPEEVYAAIDHYNRNLGTAAGRGSYRRAQQAGELVRSCRQALARLLNAPAPEQIVMTSGGTESLNLALHGLLQRGDHVIASEIDHNSVLRPLQHLAEQGVEITLAPCDMYGRIDHAALQAAFTPATRLVVVSHASNVTGAVQDLTALAAIIQQTKALMLVDAAQTAGHRKIDVQSPAIDLLACSGHKGLMGPLGTGLLYIRPGLETEIRPLRQGGTGTIGHGRRHPEQLPERFEAGNVNMMGIAGLEAAARWQIQHRDHVLQREHQQLAQLLDGLSAMPAVTVHGPPTPVDRVGVVSISLQNWSPQELAAVLDSDFGIEVRAGLHCAPLTHSRIGTESAGGTVRISLGAFTSETDIRALLEALRSLAA